MKKKILPLRTGVGIVVLNSKNQVFVDPPPPRFNVGWCVGIFRTDKFSTCSHVSSFNMKSTISSHLRIFKSRHDSTLNRGCEGSEMINFTPRHEEKTLSPIVIYFTPKSLPLILGTHLSNNDNTMEIYKCYEGTLMSLFWYKKDSCPIQVMTIFSFS